MVAVQTSIATLLKCLQVSMEMHVSKFALRQEMDSVQTASQECVVAMTTRINVMQLSVVLTEFKRMLLAMEITIPVSCVHPEPFQ